jgi:hypothetical protein
MGACAGVMAGVVAALASPAAAAKDRVCRCRCGYLLLSPHSRECASGDGTRIVGLEYVGAVDEEEEAVDMGH